MYRPKCLACIDSGKDYKGDPCTFMGCEKGKEIMDETKAETQTENETETPIKMAHVFALTAPSAPKREDMAESDWTRIGKRLVPPKSDVLAETSYPLESGDLDIAVLDVVSRAKGPCRVVLVAANKPPQALGRRDRRMLVASAKRKLAAEVRQERIARNRERARIARLSPTERAYELTAKHVGKPVHKVTRADLRAARKAGAHNASERTIAAERKAQRACA